MTLFVSNIRNLLSEESEHGNFNTDTGKLIKSSAIYALAGVVLPFVTLLLAPFLTHRLSRTDYGVLAVLTTAIALMAGITQFGLNNAFFRAYSYDYQSEEDKREVLSTVCTLLILSSSSFLFIAILAAPWFSLFLFNNVSYSTPVKLAALIVFLQNLTVPGLSWLRAESRALTYTVLIISNFLVNMGATFVFIAFFHLGLAGALLATASGYAIIMVCTLPLLLPRVGLHLRLDIAWNLFSFGAPLVANLISIWVLQLSDRYLLSRLGSLAQTASYTIAYSLGGILGVVFLSPFSLAWPTAMFAIAKKEQATHIFRLIFRWYSFFSLFATFGLVLVSVNILILFFPASYYAALPVIPIVALSILFFGIYSFFTIGISIKRKTWLAAMLTMLSALVNVGCNIILIPFYGSMGAAASTLIAYLFLAITGYFVNQSIYPIKFEIGLFTIALSVGIALSLGSNFIDPLTGAHPGSIFLYISALGLYSIFLVLLGKHSSGKLKHPIAERQHYEEEYAGYNPEQ